MAVHQSTSRGGVRYIGDYQIGRQIGSGSFSVVWHARHKVHNVDVAIKEIVMDRLSKKLQESLRSEIYILQKINHPNIIRLHDIIEVEGKIHLVLEYCKGGDLSVYIQRHGKVPEVTAKHFMKQLAAGLLVLRENNLIHRDLKPQNLLLSANDDQSVLKIADFGFARSLQPRGLAETLCGSPLYMAPEIMQLQKYDAKADLWSVGAILFQLVTGATPFTGNNQIQLLQNIIRSNELRFPPDIRDLSSDCIDLCRKLLRRNPVERLTFEEFFNHPFLPQKEPQEPPRPRESPKNRDAFPRAVSSHGRYTEESSQDDLPFVLDDDSSGPDGSPSFPSRRASTRYNTDMSKVGPRLDHHRHKGPIKEQKPVKASSSREVADSMELIERDYVLVPGPPLEVSSSSENASRPHVTSVNKSSVATAPMPIIGAQTTSICGFGSLESQSSGPSATSQGSMDVGDALEQPSIDSATRIRSLQQFADAITELVNEKVKIGKQLEAFSIQLVILAVWKQALHICHTQAASAIEGSNNKMHGSLDVQESTQGPEAVCSQIEKEFLHQVGHAEDLARGLEPGDGNTAMPDAMETIFQSALILGRAGAVDELMGNMESAATLYSKAVHLLRFLLVEAPSLILNPPFTLTNSDRFRLRTYIEILNNRQGQSRSQRMALLNCDDQQLSM
ncbi:non-specific serine/threonine protein kinase [Ranunculus cassubicifolius]